MALKVYKHWQSAQTMVIYLVPPTEVSLLDSQYDVRTCNNPVVTQKTCDLAQIIYYK